MARWDEFETPVEKIGKLLDFIGNRIKLVKW